MRKKLQQRKENASKSATNIEERLALDVAIIITIGQNQEMREEMLPFLMIIHVGICIC